MPRNMTPQQIWPFLVAAGRIQDYRVLMAPDFLLKSREYGRIGDVVRRTEDEVATASLKTRASGTLAVAWQSRTVRREEVGESPSKELVLDHNGRPIDIIYGYVATEPASGISLAEMRAARTRAIDVFREFLRDEKGFSVRPSEPVQLSLSVEESIRRRVEQRQRSRRVLVPRRILVLAASTLVAGAVGLFAYRTIGAGETPTSTAGVGCVDPELVVDQTGGPTSSPTIAFSPDGKLVATIDTSGQIQIRDRKNLTLARRQISSDRFRNATGLYFGPGDGVLAVVAERVYFFNTSTGDVVGHSDQVGSGQVRSVAFDPSSSLVALSLTGGQVELWRVSKDSADLIVTTPDSTGGALTFRCAD